MDQKDKILAFLQSDAIIENYLKQMPNGITICTTNVCNARCFFCAYQINQDPKEIMSNELFQKIIDDAQVAGRVDTLVLTPVAGDPLTNPRIFEQIAYARSKGIKHIEMATNGILLGKNNNYAKLVDSGVNMLHVSVPNLNRELYAKVFGVDKLDQVVEGIVKLCQAKKESNSDIILRISLTPGNKEEFESPYWQALLPYYMDETITHAARDSFLKTIENFRNNITEPQPEGCHNYNSIDNWSGVISDDMIPEGYQTQIKHPTHDAHSLVCWRFLHDHAVMSNGDVRICSCRYLTTTHDELVIGNVKEDTISNIYFGDRHKALIKRVAGGDWPKVCLECSLYLPLELGNSYIDFLYSELENPPPFDGNVPLSRKNEMELLENNLQIAQNMASKQDWDKAASYLTRASLSYNRLTEEELGLTRTLVLAADFMELKARIARLKNASNANELENMAFFYRKKAMLAQIKGE